LDIAALSHSDSVFPNEETNSVQNQLAKTFKLLLKDHVSNKRPDL